MAILKCDKDGACTCVSLSVVRCAKAIAIVQAAKQTSKAPERSGHLRVIDGISIRSGDTVRVGLRQFDADSKDIVITDESDETVSVSVIDNDRVIYEGTQKRDLVRFVPVDGSGAVPLIDALESEREFVQLDTEDLRTRGMI
jgi:hypothetical protein